MDARRAFRGGPVAAAQAGHECNSRHAGFIRAYNEVTGTPNTDTSGYHETITLASLRAARAWLAARPHSTLHRALEELLASPFGRSDWLLRYWTRPVLFSVAARRAWVEPDVESLPF